MAFWNPRNADFFSGRPPLREFVTKRTTDSRMPNPDPEEHFNHMTFQLFGPQVVWRGAPKQMKGL
jgi:phospholipase C